MVMPIDNAFILPVIARLRSTRYAVNFDDYQVWKIIYFQRPLHDLLASYYMVLFWFSWKLLKPNERYSLHSYKAHFSFFKPFPSKKISEDLSLLAFGFLLATVLNSDLNNSTKFWYVVP